MNRKRLAQLRKVFEHHEKAWNNAGSGSGGPYYSMDIGRVSDSIFVEDRAHDFAHWIVLGKRKPFVSTLNKKAVAERIATMDEAIDRACKKATAEHANQMEALACVVELNGLNQLGLDMKPDILLWYSWDSLRDNTISIGPKPKFLKQRKLKLDDYKKQIIELAKTPKAKQLTKIFVDSIKASESAVR